MIRKKLQLLAGIISLFVGLLWVTAGPVFATVNVVVSVPTTSPTPTPAVTQNPAPTGANTNPATQAVNTNPVTVKKPLKLYINGMKADPAVQAIVQNQIKYINLPFLVKYLHAVTQWDPVKGDITIRLGALNVDMSEDKTDYMVNDTPHSLANAPFETDGQLWLPLEYICSLGLTVKKDERGELNLVWNDNYLLSIENVTYQSRPAILLKGTGGFQINSFILPGPDRLVADLKGIKAHFAFDANLTGNPLIKQVRFHQQSENSLRVVFDLNHPAGFRLVQQPGQEQQALIVFNYEVEDIRFIQKDQERKLYLLTSSPAQYTVIRLTRPDRLVIDLDGASLTEATLAVKKEPIPGDGIWIKNVRISQYDLKTVRVVLDLADKALCFIKPVRDNPNLIEIRGAQTVNKIMWTQTAPGCGDVIIQADGELVEKVQRMKNPDKLRVDLAYSRMAPGLTAPEVHNNLVRSAAVATTGEAVVRLELTLEKFVDCRIEFSPDQRQMIIHLKVSPLVGKVIVLDPGHGGVDPGAIGGQGTLEKEVNLDVTMRLKCLLEEGGAGVVLTRHDDSYIGLYERPFEANYLFADLFISIHSNTHPNLTVRGTEVYYYPAHSGDKILAQFVADRMHELTGLLKLGVKTNDFVVIRETQMPGILVELGFLSNSQEETILTTPEFRDAAARGICQGVKDYYEK